MRGEPFAMKLCNAASCPPSEARDSAGAYCGLVTCGLVWQTRHALQREVLEGRPGWLRRCSERPAREHDQDKRCAAPHVPISDGKANRPDGSRFAPKRMPLFHLPGPGGGKPFLNSTRMAWNGRLSKFLIECAACGGSLSTSGSSGLSGSGSLSGLPLAS